MMKVKVINLFYMWISIIGYSEMTKISEAYNMVFWKM